MGDWNPGQMGGSDWHPGVDAGQAALDGVPSRTSPSNTMDDSGKEGTGKLSTNGGGAAPGGYKKKKKKTPEQAAAARAGQQQALGES